MADNTHDRGDAAVDVARDFFGWVSELERHDAAQLLDNLHSAATDALAMVVTRAIHGHPDSGLDRLDVLALVVLMLNGDAIDRTIDPADQARVAATAHNAIAHRLRGIFETRQQALFAAIRQLGTARVFGVAEAVEAELGSRTGPASAASLDLAERRAGERHGWFVRFEDRLGWVLFRTNDGITNGDTGGGDRTDRPSAT